MQGVLIVDGANWSAALEATNRRINYDWLVSAIQEATGVQIVGFSYYTTYRTQSDLDRRWPFFNYLKDLGWQIQVMPATLGADGRWRDKEVDIAIALDAYEESRFGAINALLLGSGDEDFAALFRRLPQGVEGWAIGFRDHTSPSLKKVANILYVDDLDVLYPVRASLGSSGYDPEIGGP